MTMPTFLDRFDNAETVGHEVTVGISEHPRFVGKPAVNIRQKLGGAGGGIETIYSVAVLDDLIAQLQRARREMEIAGNTILAVALMVIADQNPRTLVKRLDGHCRHVQIAVGDGGAYRIDLDGVPPVSVPSLDVAKTVAHELFGVTEWRRVASDTSPDVTYQPLDGDCEAWR